jgi:hypothetical protein
LAQLQKERQKQQNNRDGQYKEQLEDQDEQKQDKEDHHQPVVTRVPGTNNTQITKKQTPSTAANSVSTKKQMSMLTSKTSAAADDEQRQPTVIRVAGANNTQLAKQPTSCTAANSVVTKKQRSMTTSNTSAAEDDEQHQPTVTRVARGVTTMSMKKHTPSTAANPTTLNKDVSSVTSDSKSSQENEQHYGYQPQVTRIPRSELSMSLRKQISNKSSKNSNVNVFTTYNNSNLESSQISNPLQSSSINLVSKSEIFDQEFYLDGNIVHGRDAKRRGTVNISGRGK